MMGPTIYIPSGLAKLLIPLTSSREQMLPALTSLAEPVTHRLGPNQVWGYSCLTCCPA